MTPSTEVSGPRGAQRVPASMSPAPSSNGSRTVLWLSILATLVPLVCLAIPMYVIRPFRPQDPSQLAAALTIRGVAPWLSAVCAIFVVLASFGAWKNTSRLWLRIGLVTLSLIVVTAACLTHINIFEIMFHPYSAPAFGSAAAAQVDADDKVLAVRIGSESHAYPIRTMGYHHIVNDVVGNTPVAVTYCTLCHTGLVWKRELDGRTLRFRLAGINNGNALIRDEETSSIWQQSTGQAIFGPLKGRQLQVIHSDELTFSLWRKEQPGGLVLKPDAEYASEYENKDWEKHVESTKTVVDTRKSGISPHELMFGLTIAGQSKAYAVKSILAAKVIQDQIGGIPILIIVGPDQASIRVFKTTMKSSNAETPMTFLSVHDASTASQNASVLDAETNSRWNFAGCATEGSLAGQCLEPVDGNKDYWFDWFNHHPSTAVFKG